MSEFVETEEQKVYRYHNIRIAKVTTNVGEEFPVNQTYLVTYNKSGKFYLEPFHENKTIQTDLTETYDISANFLERVNEGLKFHTLKEDEILKIPALYPIIKEWFVNDEPKINR